MRDITIKADGVGDTLPADDFNALQAELENIVTSTDQTLDPNGGPDTDINMLSKAAAAYANAGNTYQDSGSANTYVLSLPSNLKHVTKYYDGMTVIFKAGNNNTGASTINVNALGAKAFTTPSGSTLSADYVVSGSHVIAIFNDSSNRFESFSQALATITGHNAAAHEALGIVSSWPYFSSGMSSTPSISTLQTLIFDTEFFDTNSYYNNSTGIFTPTSAGIYRFTVRIRWFNVTTSDDLLLKIIKNTGSGAGETYNKSELAAPANGIVYQEISCVFEANGTTDSFKVTCRSSTNANNIGGTDTDASFFGGRVG